MLDVDDALALGTDDGSNDALVDFKLDLVLLLVGGGGQAAVGSRRRRLRRWRTGGQSERIFIALRMELLLTERRSGGGSATKRLRQRRSARGGRGRVHGWVDGGLSGRRRRHHVVRGQGLVGRRPVVAGGPITREMMAVNRRSGSVAEGVVGEGLDGRRTVVAGVLWSVDEVAERQRCRRRRMEVNSAASGG